MVLILARALVAILSSTMASAQSPSPSPAPAPSPGPSVRVQDKVPLVPIAVRRMHYGDSSDLHFFLESGAASTSVFLTFHNPSEQSISHVSIAVEPGSGVQKVLGQAFIASLPARTESPDQYVFEVTVDPSLQKGTPMQLLIQGAYDDENGKSQLFSFPLQLAWGYGYPLEFIYEAVSEESDRAKAPGFAEFRFDEVQDFGFGIQEARLEVEYEHKEVKYMSITIWGPNRTTAKLRDSGTPLPTLGDDGKTYSEVFSVAEGTPLVRLFFKELWKVPTKGIWGIYFSDSAGKVLDGTIKARLVVVPRTSADQPKPPFVAEGKPGTPTLDNDDYWMLSGFWDGHTGYYDHVGDQRLHDDWCPEFRCSGHDPHNHPPPPWWRPSQHYSYSLHKYWRYR